MSTVKKAEPTVDSTDARKQTASAQGSASCAIACPHQCQKTKVRSEEEVRSLMNRLSRIEGQVRGVRGMVERNAYCTDILTQVAAVTAALNAFNRELLGNHVRTCVANNLRAGHDEIVDELMDTLQKLLK